MFIIFFLYKYTNNDHIQEVLSGETLSLRYLDTITILLKYCCTKSIDKRETQAVIVDAIATLGYFCNNNRKNQVC